MNNVTNLEYNKPFIRQRADPHMLRHTDGAYYFTATIPSYDKIVIRKSKTIVGLVDAEEITVWEKHKSGLMSEHIWAPELHYINKKWYLYFAAGQVDDVWNIRPYVLECQSQDPAEGTFKELGPMQPADEDEFSFRAFSLDGTVFSHRGEWYFVWAEKVGAGKQISNLYIAQMESPVKLKTMQVLLTTPDYEWERHGFWVNEGPFILKKNGMLYLTYSASDTGCDYCIGMLSTSGESDLLDPRSWKKSRYPVCRSDEQKGIFGPGHNCFTVTEEGEDLMVYHGRTTKDIIGNPLKDPNRHTMIMKVKWDSENRPVFSFS